MIKQQLQITNFAASPGKSQAGNVRSPAGDKISRSEQRSLLVFSNYFQVSTQYMECVLAHVIVSKV